ARRVSSNEEQWSSRGGMHMNGQADPARTVAITEVVNRYFAALDDKQFDEATLKRVFTDGAKITRPNGSTVTGPKEIGENHQRSLSRFRATQHLTSGFVITLIDDLTAEIRVNLVAMHVWAVGQGDPHVDPKDNFFLAGSVVTGR